MAGQRLLDLGPLGVVLERGGIRLRVGKDGAVVSYQRETQTGRCARLLRQRLQIGRGQSGCVQIAVGENGGKLVGLL